MNSSTYSKSVSPDAQDVLVTQDWSTYTANDHKTWAQLYQDSTTLLKGRTIPEFFTGLEEIQLSKNQVVNFQDLSTHLKKKTGWEYVAVPGFIPTDTFFELLATRRFPSSCFMRQPDGVSYQELPDIFHDVYGHAPLLMDQTIADFIQAFGVAGGAARSDQERTKLARLYWYTIEVGLIHRGGDRRVYGAAIASSRKETLFALESDSPHQIWFDAERVMRTPYSMYDLQETYFVIPDLQVLVDLARTGFDCVRKADHSLPDYELGELAKTDKIIQRGTQSYHAAIGETHSAEAA